MSSQENPEASLPSGQRTAHGVMEREQNPFADPGLPAHLPRIQDIDRKAAKRSERAVGFLFLLSMLATVAFIASYVAFPVGKIVYVFPFGHVSILNFSLGVTLGIALLGIGVGAIHWARTLMSDVEITDLRHPIEAPPEVKAKVLQDFADGRQGLRLRSAQAPRHHDVRRSRHPAALGSGPAARPRSAAGEEAPLDPVGTRASSSST